MPARTGGENKEFLEFLKTAPALEDAASGKTSELSGVISRTTDGRFAITTGEGQTYELEVAAVRRFRLAEGPGLTPVATIEVDSEVLKNATIRPLKPVIKDLIKDPIKEVIYDGTLHAKDLRTDPLVDKQFPKDLHTDPPIDTPTIKDIRTDPAVDKPVIKDIHKDPVRDPLDPGFKNPLRDPLDTGIPDIAGTGPADVGGIPDPTGQVTNPAAQFAGAGMAGLTPFVMATPHHAPQHLVAMQAGLQPAVAGQAQLKPFALDTLKEVAWAETIKEPIRDTYKELARDTYKELVWDTWVEGGPYTVVEGTFDPGQGVIQPAGFGQPGFM